MEHNKNAYPEQWDSGWGLNGPSAALFTMRVGGWSVSVGEQFQDHVLMVGTSAPTSPATSRVREPVRARGCAAVLLRWSHTCAWEFIKNIAAQVGSKDEPWTSMQ
jgi:hypothetical protein